MVGIDFLHCNKNKLYEGCQCKHWRHELALSIPRTVTNVELVAPRVLSCRILGIMRILIREALKVKIF